ncbi:MAG: TlpA disulfide reductase family protein, partial [Verrucomicrobiota bacterium]
MSGELERIVVGTMVWILLGGFIVADVRAESDSEGDGEVPGAEEGNDEVDEGLGWVYGGTDRKVGEGFLVWNHSESIRGRFAGISEDGLVWEAPQYFRDPLTVDLAKLRRVNFSTKGTQPAEPSSIRLRDGSRLYADVVAVDADSVTLQSDRHGEVRVKRDAVLSVRRLKGGRLKYAGPTSVAGWEGLDEAKTRRQFWREGSGGVLTQVGWNKRAFLKLKTDERVEIEVVLGSSVSPRFRMEFLTPEGKRGLTLETWDDELVLQGRQFASLRTLEDEDRELSLRLFWDRKTGRTAVFSDRGEKLAESKMAALEPEGEEAQTKTPKEEGLLLHNKGPELTLDSLRIRSWDGVVPEGRESVRPNVILMDGTMISGAVERLDGGTAIVREATNGRRREVSWRNVESVEFDPRGDWPVEEHGVELWFTDGAWLAGEMVEADEEGITLRTSLSAQPVRSAIDDIGRMMLRIPEAEDGSEELPYLQQDKLVVGKKNLRGQLVTGGNGLRWKPIGARKAVRLQEGDGVEFTRGEASTSQGARAEALLYLKEGDVVPGKLRGVGEEHLQFESDIVERSEYPVEDVSAVQFMAAKVELSGFVDDGWEQIRGSDEGLEIGEDRLTFQPGTSFAHPSIIQGDQIKFSFGGDRHSYAAMRVRLFCSGTDMDSPSLNLVFGRYSQDIVFGVERVPNQLDSQNRLNSPAGKATPIRLGLKEDIVEVFINGISVRKVQVKPEMRSGIGLVIEPCGLWGNDERTCSIADFEVRAAPGITSVPGIDAVAKEQALTVPRFRRDDPPRHALVALNGDLLRGVIEGMTTKHYLLRSGLEKLRIPRSRVSAVVWLTGWENGEGGGGVSPEDSGAREEAEKVTHWLQLASGGRLGIEVDRFAKDRVYGKHSFLGECEVPIDVVHLVRGSALNRSGAMQVFEDWELVFAKDPVLPESGGQSSELLGTKLKDFSIPYLGDGNFDSEKERGKVLVLDFWATWCGPCVKALPELIDAMAEFDEDEVLFVGVNQGESAERVKRFLETRGWEMEVAMDAQQRVGQSFGVEGIPHTVIVGPDGTVEWVKTGYDPAGA